MVIPARDSLEALLYQRQVVKVKAWKPGLPVVVENKNRKGTSSSGASLEHVCRTGEVVDALWPISRLLKFLRTGKVFA